MICYMYLIGGTSMIMIKEVDSYLGISYDIYFDEKKVKKVFIQRIKKNYEGKEFIFLLDSNRKVIEKVFEYLNFTGKFNADNSIEQAATALKLVYSYSEIINKNIEDFSKGDIYYFSEFILGISVKGNINSFELSRKRGNSTHNLYFDAIRRYLTTNNINNEYFFEKRIVEAKSSGFGMFTHTQSRAIEKYKTNKSTGTIESKFIPKYISNQEYHKIIDYIEHRKSEHNERDKLIVNLMYGLGLRLGEVLGSTLEDIKINNNRPDAGFLYIRNRLSDKKYQLAKTCHKPRNKEDYESKIYEEKDLGYQRVTLAPTLMREIQNYREQSRDMFSISSKRIGNIYELAKADCIEDSTNENYYLFLNKNGTPLSSSGWNKVIKKIFQEVGIEIDKNFKKDNLSHRFRHGYAMYLIEIEHKDIIYVKEMMRHKNISSTLKYFNPHENEILKERERIQAKMLSKVKGDNEDES